MFGRSVPGCSLALSFIVGVNCRRVKLLQAGLRQAGEQGAKLWELRCATSLANVWLGEGKTAAACAVLAPIYDWFSEGFEMPDMVDARTLVHHACYQRKPNLQPPGTLDYVISPTGPIWAPRRKGDIPIIK
jgi:hypothetical protein